MKSRKKEVKNRDLLNELNKAVEDLKKSKEKRDAILKDMHQNNDI